MHREFMAAGPKACRPSIPACEILPVKQHANHQKEYLHVFDD